MHKVVLYGISDNMSALVYNKKYGTINNANPTIMGCCVVKLLAETYTLKEYKRVEKQVIKIGRLIVKAD